MRLPGPASAPLGGDVSLDFADTDIRAVVGQVLGTILKANYTIDPAVHGTATFHTSQPLARSQLLPTLETLLAQDNAALIESSGIYRVVPAAAAGATPGTAAASAAAVAGGVLVPLRYASAEQLVKVLQPFVGAGGRIVADPGRDALLVTGDPAVRDTLVRLIQAFDVNVLAGQSYALLPVVAGDAKDFATALETALRAKADGALAGVVRVVPLERIDAVLVMAPEPGQIDAARRVFGLVQQARRATVRTWRVYYLRNSRAEDIAYILQQAFTPDNVSALPPGSSRPAGAETAGITSQSASAYGTSGALVNGGIGAAGGIGTGGINAAGMATGGAGAGGVPSVLVGELPQEVGAAPAAPPTPPPSGNPLLGGLQATGAAASTTTAEAMRIIPDDQNNAELVYATPAEQDTVAAMLRKIDILPLQVRIDAVIAEVTLNDQLQYGTQFFFKSGGINGILNNASVPQVGNPASTVLGTSFPGFLISGHDQGGAPLAISALQAVTQVRVLSSPEIMVLDGQSARLQVGDLVPYLTSSSQGTLVPNAPIINSVQYQPTGVIMRVTPHIDTGGEVTLDIGQEVSEVNTSSPQTPGINSPTFSERSVTSRVVVQDGQTVGLAGLISDTVTRGNQGIPWLKDIPLLGFLAGTQNNNRTRTELLVLITPHVMHDERDARALTEDLRDSLINAAAVPQELNGLPVSGSADPNANLRRQLDLR